MERTPIFPSNTIVPKLVPLILMGQNTQRNTVNFGFQFPKDFGPGKKGSHAMKTRVGQVGGAYPRKGAEAAGACGWEFFIPLFPAVAGGRGPVNVAARCLESELRAEKRCNMRFIDSMFFAASDTNVVFLSFSFFLKFLRGVLGPRPRRNCSVKQNYCATCHPTNPMPSRYHHRRCSFFAAWGCAEGNCNGSKMRDWKGRSFISESEQNRGAAPDPSPAFAKIFFLQLFKRVRFLRLQFAVAGWPVVPIYLPRLQFPVPCRGASATLKLCSFRCFDKERPRRPTAKTKSFAERLFFVRSNYAQMQPRNCSRKSQQRRRAPDVQRMCGESAPGHRKFCRLGRVFRKFFSRTV